MADEDMELGDSFTLAFQELQHCAVDLLINVGIISSLRERWPEEVQQNWINELHDMKERMDDEVRVAQEFASALD